MNIRTYVGYTGEHAENHFAILIAKIRDSVNYASLDPTMVALAKEYYSDFDNSEETKPRNLMILQIIGESCSPENYNHTKNNGYLFKLKIANNIFDSIKQPTEIVHEFPGVHTKVRLETGYIHKTDNSEYKILLREKNSVGYGFYLEIWNNHQADIKKKHCGQMMNQVTDRIDKKYKEFIEILEQKII